MYKYWANSEFQKTSELSVLLKRAEKYCLYIMGIIYTLIKVDIHIHQWQEIKMLNLHVEHWMSDCAHPAVKEWLLGHVPDCSKTYLHPRPICLNGLSVSVHMVNYAVDLLPFIPDVQCWGKKAASSFNAASGRASCQTQQNPSHYTVHVWKTCHVTIPVV